MIRVAGDHGGGERGIGGRETADVLRDHGRGVFGQLFDLAVQQQRNEHVLMKGDTRRMFNKKTQINSEEPKENEYMMPESDSI